MLALPRRRRRHPSPRTLRNVFAYTATLLLGFTPGLVPESAAQEEEEQEAQDTIPVYELEPIEVWVVREKSQARRAESFALFTQDDLRRSEELSPYEFFKSVPGVNLIQGHALGFGLRNPVAGRIQIRGIGRKAGVDMSVRGVLLLMDGVPDFSVTHGHPLPDMFSRAYVDEVEVIKGPSSVRHGWAQAGVILMRSRDPQRMGSSGYLEGSFGTFATTQNQGHYNYRWSDGFVQLSGAFRRSDGHRASSETEAADGRIRAAQQLSSRVAVVGSIRGGTNNWEIPGRVGGQPGVGGENDWIIADGGVRARLGMWDLTGKVWAFDANVEFEDGLKEPNQAQGGRIKAETSPWAGGSLLLGTDFMNYSIGRGQGEDVPTIESPEEIAPYVWASHETGPWILSGGARFTHNDQFGEDLSPEVGAVFRPIDGTSVRARVAHGFRAPNPFEFAFFDTRNPDLDATDLWQFELGWNQRVANYVRFDIVGWVQDGDSMIQAVFDPVVQDVRNQNTGEFTHSGLEAQVQAAHPSGVHGGLAVAAMDLGDETALVPQYTLDFWAGFRRSGFDVSVDGRWAAERFQRDNSEVPLPDYVIANLNAAYRLRNGVALRARVENLFDEDYELFQGWPMPGASVFGGVSVTY